MSTKAEKIQYAIMHNPNLISTLLKDTSINKGMLYRKLNKAIPCRIGIEFELAGNFLEAFRDAHKLKTHISEVNKAATDYYKVIEIKGDTTGATIGYDGSVGTPDSIANTGEPVGISHRNAPAKPDIPLYEVRISISNFKHLKGLYRFMEDLVKYCKIHEGGGIHVHIDISQFKWKGETKQYELHHYITHRLSYIGTMFPKYKGKYNRRKVGMREKGTWVNISRLDTLEFRILPLTFDYFTLMTWIERIVKFRQDMIHYCRLKPLSTETVSTISESNLRRLNDMIVEYRDDLNRSLNTSNVSWHVTHFGNTSSSGYTNGS